jgi:hypothetical protein
MFGKSLLAGPSDYLMFEMKMQRAFVSEWPSLRQLCAISDAASHLFRVPVLERPPLPPANYWEVDQELAAHDPEYFEDWWHWRERTVSALHPHVQAPGTSLPDLRSNIREHSGDVTDFTPFSALITVPECAKARMLKVVWKIPSNPRGWTNLRNLISELQYRLALECSQLWPDPLPYHVSPMLESQGTRPGEAERNALIARAMDRRANRNAMKVWTEGNEHHPTTLASSAVPDIASHPLSDLLAPLDEGGVVSTSSPGILVEDESQHAIRRLPGFDACAPAGSVSSSDEPRSPVLEVRSEFAASEGTGCEQSSLSPTSASSPSGWINSSAALRAAEILKVLVEVRPCCSAPASCRC